MYCPKCGAKVDEDAKFCQNCGAPLSRVKAETAIQAAQTDIRLQGNWGRRIIAYIIDSIVVGIASAILFLILWFPIIIAAVTRMDFSHVGGWTGFPFIGGLFLLLYFVVMEAIYGQTVGKMVMNLKVITVSRGLKPDLGKTLIRNISKIHFALLFLDVIGGLITRGDPRQKFSDRIAGTTVAG